MLPEVGERSLLYRTFVFKLSGKSLPVFGIIPQSLVAWTQYNRVLPLSVPKVNLTKLRKLHHLEGFELKIFHLIDTLMTFCSDEGLTLEASAQ